MTAPSDTSPEDRPLKTATRLVAAGRRPEWTGTPDHPGAVVNPGGRVIGTDNLSVADASVMPRLPSANTNVPTLMIAEKIAERMMVEMG